VIKNIYISIKLKCIYLEEGQFLGSPRASGISEPALWETLESREKFLDEVRRKGPEVGKKMVYERKKEMREKYLKELPGWILGTIMRELNLSNTILIAESLDTYCDCQ
jgi:hypothetical protein